MVLGVVFATPLTVALTVPFGNLVAVLWVFRRLGAEEIFTSVRREPRGVRRLVAPVIGTSAVMGALMLVSNTQILPRANERLAKLFVASQRSEREMLIGELRVAARSARAEGGSAELAHAALYEVEIHKRIALAAACVVVALAGAAFSLLFPGCNTVLVICSAFFIFSVHYVAINAGEALAHHLLVSPFVGTWMGNAILLAFALPVLLWLGRAQAQGSRLTPPR